MARFSHRAILCALAFPTLGLSAASAQCDRSLISDDAALNDRFGACIDMTSNVAFAGAPQDDRAGLTDAGAVYRFTRTGFDWPQTQKLVAPDGQSGAQFGTSLGYGQYVVVGAPNANTPVGTDRGAAYVYQYDTNSGQWVFLTKIAASDGGAGDRFGASVSTYGEWVLVGAPYNDNARGADAGAAYLYHRSGATFSLVSKIINADGVTGDRNGWAVSITEDNIATSAYFASSGGHTSNGAVYAYRFNDENASVLPTFEAKLTASDGYDIAGFGYRIAAQNDYIVVGDGLAGVGGQSGAGKIYIYTRNSNNGTWGERIGLPNPAVALQRIGTSVAISGSRIIAGGDGAAASFHLSGDVYLNTTITDPSPSAEDSFGSAVAIYNDVAIVADSLDASGGVSTGRAHAVYLNAVGADACDTAADLYVGSGATTVNGCTGLATPSGVGPGCGNTAASSDVFYRIEPRCTGAYTMSTTGSEYDTVLSVHNACPANAASAIACNDDIVAGNHDSQLVANLTAGQVYYIRVGGFQSNAGVYSLTVEATGAAPANDNCVTATNISTGTFPVATCNATIDNNVYTTCSSGYNDVWFRFTAPCAGVVTAETCNSNNYDTTLDLYPANCNIISQAPLRCNDDFCGLGSRVAFTTNAGAQYLIRVAGWGGNVGSANLNVTCNACPCNWNQDAFVNSQDFFDFLNAFFQSNADYNVDGFTNSQDYFDFLTCFFAGC